MQFDIFKFTRNQSYANIKKTTDQKKSVDTQDIVEKCVEAGLPTPEYKQDGMGFKVVIWRKSKKMNDPVRVITFELMTNHMHIMAASDESRIRQLNDLADARNGFLVHDNYTPFSYPWGANYCYFNFRGCFAWTQGCCSRFSARKDNPVRLVRLIPGEH